jgi:hypothetical protein
MKVILKKSGNQISHNVMSEMPTRRPFYAHFYHTILAEFETSQWLLPNYSPAESAVIFASDIWLTPYAILHI